MGNRLRIWCVVVGLVVPGIGCGGSGGDQPVGDASYIEVDLDKSNPEQLLRYYFGGYVGPDGGDPFEAGMLVARDGDYFVDLGVLEAQHPGTSRVLEERAGDDRLAWKELEGFLNATYYTARNLPPTLEALRADVPFGAGDEPWFRVELDGVMTVARRRVYVAESALRYAVRTYHEHDEALLYPDGTTIVGEHVLDGQVVETTVMRKRGDGFWDFFTYGSDGALAAATASPPRALKTPTQCVGCHLGSKLFEPERSFPGEASPGPHGPRALYVPEAWRDLDVVTFFDEHRKRSDTVLGLYNTLFVARLRAERRAGTLSEDDAALLADVGL